MYTQFSPVVDKETMQSVEKKGGKKGNTVENIQPTFKTENSKS